MTEMVNFTIRTAVASDCGRIRDLIMELAAYEKMSDQVKITAGVLEQDGFGEDKYFHCFIAETEETAKEPSLSKTIVGYVLYFYMYSTWEGKFIHMEDLYVQPEYRGKGIGTALWKRITQVAVEKDCKRVQWAVLDWNTPSIEYYKRQGGIDLTETEGWHVFRMCRTEMNKFISKVQIGSEQDHDGIVTASLHTTTSTA